jgi:hypothetical protein
LSCCLSGRNRSLPKNSATKTQQLNDPDANINEYSAELIHG